MSAALRPWWGVGGASVVALWTSSGLYVGSTSGLMGPKEPESGGPLAEYVESYLAYRKALFPYEQWQNWMLTLALLGIGLLAAGLFVVPRDSRQAIPIRLGSLALAAGAVVAAVAQVAYLGAVEKVFAVSEIAYFDTGSLATMVDAATRTDDYVENLGFLVMAAGLVMLAWPREAGDDATSGLRVANWALAIALTAAVMSSFTESVLAIPVLLVVGFAVAPAWILVAARKLDRSTPR